MRTGLSDRSPLYSLGLLLFIFDKLYTVDLHQINFTFVYKLVYPIAVTTFFLSVVANRLEFLFINHNTNVVNSFK